MLKNTNHQYGWVAIVFHWGMALLVIGLFVLGLYMRTLDYYDAWYRLAPHIHRSLGILLFLAWALRLLWKLANTSPRIEGSRFEIAVAHMVHALMYVLLLSIFISGYLISTADGRAIAVFNWFEVPSVVTGVENLSDSAGVWHYWLAVTLISLVLVHALAALKHHFINKDNTLRRMLGKA